MAWTQNDIDALRAAITSLVNGTRVVTASYTGPPARSVTYQMGDLEQMRALLAEMVRTVGGGGTSYRLGATRSGL